IACGCLFFVLFPYIITATIGCFVVGLGVSCIMPLVFSLTAKQANMTAGPAIASVSTVGYLGLLAGPSVIGFISHASDLRWSFTLIICFGFIIAWVVSKLRIGR